MEPRHYQERALAEVEAGDGTSLLAADLGTGKTPIATWLLQYYDAQLVLIVGPLRTEDGWRRHVELILGRELHTINKTKAGQAALNDLCNGVKGIYFTNWEYMVAKNKEKRFDGRAKKVVFKPVRHPFNGVQLDYLIADEFHRASNHQTLNFGVVSRIKATRRLALSATPAGNKPVNIWSAFTFLWPGMVPPYGKFAAKYFNTEANAFNWSGVDYTTEKRPGMVKRLAKSYVEIPQAEAYPEMPEVVVNRVYVDLSRDQRRVYNEWEEKAVAWLEAHPVAIDMPATKDLRLRQLTLGSMMSETRTRVNDRGEREEYDHLWFDKDCNSPKIDALLDILTDLPEGEPVVVWCHSQKFMVPLLYRLRKAGYKAIEVSGRSKDDWRALERGEAQVLCAVHEALAEGADGMQNVCHTEVWLSMSNSTIINTQATGRLHRGGQKHPVVRYLVMARDSIDSRVVGRLNDKYNSLKQSGLI